MKIKSKKICFSPTTFRDWSVIFCEISYLMFTREFKKQFQWHFTDAIYLWDGQKTTAYRDKDEQRRGIFELVISKMKNDKFFITDLNNKVLEEVKEIEIFFNELVAEDFDDFSKDKIGSKFDEYVSKMATIGPKLLIVQFFPMQFGGGNDLKNKFKEEIDLCIETRGKWEKFVGPTADKLAIKFGTAALKKTAIEEKLARFLTIREARTLFHGKISKSEENNLNKRLRTRVKYYLLGGGEIWSIPLKSYLEERGWELEAQIANDIKKEIKGSTCFKTTAHIKGRVVVVQNKREIGKVNEGDILVTPAVVPEYSPIYNKLLAIITDEGGITSHAAIVARELQIPCIIGTKIATQVLHDGDWVEVDADAGVVRILERIEK